MDNRYQNRNKSHSKYNNQNNQIRNYENVRKGGFDNIFDDMGFGRINEIERRFFNDHDDMFSFGFGKRFGSMFSEMESFGGNAPGTFVSKSYVSTVKMDKNGKPQKEVYQSQSISQTDNNGKKLTERQQAYKNSLTGLEKASHERNLDSKGHKIVKARNRGTGDQYEHNYYNGIQEDDLNNFNDEYKNFKNRVGDVKGNFYLQGNNNNNSRRANYELPDERNARNSEYNVLNKKKKY